MTEMAPIDSVKGSKIPDKERMKIALDFAVTNDTCKQIADRLGTSVTTVSAVVREYGLRKNFRRTPKADKWREQELERRAKQADNAPIPVEAPAAPKAKPLISTKDLDQRATHVEMLIDKLSEMDEEVLKRIMFAAISRQATQKIRQALNGAI